MGKGPVVYRVIREGLTEGDKVLKEVREPHGYLLEEHFRQRECMCKGPGAKNVPGLLEGQQGGLCGWSRVMGGGRAVGGSEEVARPAGPCRLRGRPGFLLKSGTGF